MATPGGPSDEPGDGSPSLAEVLDEQEWVLLEALIDIVVPGTTGAMRYLSGRRAAGRLDGLDDLRGGLDAAGEAAALVAAWSGAEPGTRERRWFETVRAWGWEALLCDPSHGANSDEAGWRRFGYVGRPKSASGPASA